MCCVPPCGTRAFTELQTGNYEHAWSTESLSNNNALKGEPVAMKEAGTLFRSSVTSKWVQCYSPGREINSKRNTVKAECSGVVANSEVQ